MQIKPNSDNNQTEAQQGETIAFYGDLVSVNPKDVDFHASYTYQSAVLSYVKEHQDNPNFTVMYPHAHSHSLHSDFMDKIKEINPHTQFVQIDSIEEFSDYYNNGSETMDRELHSVESVKMLAEQDLLTYDVKQREQPQKENTINEEKPREYLSAKDIGKDGANELKALSNKVLDISSYSPEKFVAYSGLKGYDPSNPNDAKMIKIVQLEMHREFSQNYTLPSSLQMAKDNIENTIPSMPAKSIKEGIYDGVEFVHDLVGDKQEGYLELELDCETYGECHPRVYRAYENDVKKEEVNEKTSVILDDNNTREIDKDRRAINIETEQTQTLDSTLKSQEILASMNLPQHTDTNESSVGRTLYDDYGHDGID